MTYGTGQAVRECLTRDSSDTATLGSTTAGSAVVQIELPRDLRNTEFKSEEPASFRPAEAGGRTVLLGCLAAAEFAIQSPCADVRQGHLLELDTPVDARP